MSGQKIIQTAWLPEDLPSGREIQPTRDLVDFIKGYAHKEPEMAALYCLLIGFFLGWKLKPW